MKRIVLVFSLLLFSVAVFGQNLRVAVAANLQGVIKVLVKDFKEKTGIEVEPIIG